MPLSESFLKVLKVFKVPKVVKDFNDLYPRYFL